MSRPCGTKHYVVMPSIYVKVQFADSPVIVEAKATNVMAFAMTEKCKTEVAPRHRPLGKSMYLGVHMSYAHNSLTAIHQLHARTQTASCDLDIIQYSIDLKSS